MIIKSRKKTITNSIAISTSQNLKNDKIKNFLN